jgi:Icc-related predicted phosphoesterase
VGDTSGRVRLAAMADLHCTKSSSGTLQGLFSQVGTSADVLLLCGDLTAYGQPEEARILARELTAAAKIPIIAVLGNHEYEAGRQDEVRAIVQDAGVTVLDGDACELRGIGFAGVKGFGGGFDRHSLEPWGEATMKQFVHEAVEQVLKLGSALGRLRTPRKVGVLHYSPVRATVEGEPQEIFPFLGSSRLEEPLNRYAVAMVFHGHAHNGRLEGRTSAGIPVYNVAMPLLRRLAPDRPPYRIVEIDTPPTDDLEAAAHAIPQPASGF